MIPRLSRTIPDVCGKWSNYLHLHDCYSRSLHVFHFFSCFGPKLSGLMLFLTLTTKVTILWLFRIRYCLRNKHFHVWCHVVNAYLVKHFIFKTGPCTCFFCLLGDENILYEVLRLLDLLVMLEDIPLFVRQDWTVRGAYLLSRSRFATSSLIETCWTWSLVEAVDSSWISTNPWTVIAALVMAGLFMTQSSQMSWRSW